jgi:hypothetical protein
LGVGTSTLRAVQDAYKSLLDNPADVIGGIAEAKSRIEAPSYFQQFFDKKAEQEQGKGVTELLPDIIARTRELYKQDSSYNYFQAMGGQTFIQNQSDWRRIVTAREDELAEIIKSAKLHEQQNDLQDKQLQGWTDFNRRLDELKSHLFTSVAGSTGLQKLALAGVDMVRGTIGMAPTTPEYANRKSSGVIGNMGGAGNAETQAMRLIMARGYTREQAIGMLANFKGESGLNPNAQGDYNPEKGYQAYGIAQWNPSRQADFKQWAGHDIHGTSFMEQVEFALYELEHKEKVHGDRLRAAVGIPAGVKAYLESERPADFAGALQKRTTIGMGMQAQPTILVRNETGGSAVISTAAMGAQ